MWRTVVRAAQPSAAAHATATAAAAAAPLSWSTRVARLVPERMRIVQRSVLVRRGGRSQSVHATASEYTPEYIQPYQRDLNTCPRIIDAECIHGDEQAFWGERRRFYRGRMRQCFFPAWDRQAQALIMLTRSVPRVPQEAAFRLFALAFKLMLLPRLMTVTQLLMPLQTLMNAEGLLASSLDKQAAGDTKDKASSSDDKKKAASNDASTTTSAAAAATTSDSAGNDKQTS